MSNIHIPTTVESPGILYRYGRNGSILVISLTPDRPSGAQTICVLHNGKRGYMKGILDADVPITVADLTEEELGLVIQVLLEHQ